MIGFSPEVVAAALSAPNAPGPFTIHARVMAEPTHCPACGARYTSDPMTWLAARLERRIAELENEMEVAV